VPQGSPLSPFLFNIYINDISVPKHCKIAIYADDTALTSSITNYNLEKLVERMDSGLKEIESHFSAWKIKLNSSKTESILFTKSTIMQKKMHSTKIKINDEELEWKNTVKYLGVTLDSKLTFKANLAENHLKARKTMAMLYCLLKRNSTLGLREKITLYRSYIRPIMTYACPVFANCADCHMRRLQVLQNKCLKIVLNARFRTRISLLHAKTGIPTIKSFVDKLTESFYKKSSCSENELVSRLGDYSRQSNLTRPKHRLPRPT
jgi:Reverse transcriptase (RNA-dependent DNA polymerase)